MNNNLIKIREFVIRQEREFEEFIKSILIENKLDYTNTSDNKKIFDKYTIEFEIERCINEGDFENAKKLADQYQEINGIDSNYYSILGIINVHENKLESALDNFLKGLDIDEYNLDILYNMGYINHIINNLDEALYFYKKCLQLSESENFTNQLNVLVNDISNQIQAKKVYSFVTFNIKNDDIIFNMMGDSKHKIINIVENNKIDEPNLYYNKNIKVYEVNSKDLESIIEYIIRNNENIAVIISDIYKFSTLIQFKNRIKILYYKNVNYYTDKNNLLEKNVNLFLEKECCRECDFIITNNIEIYNFKKILENRENIYFINNELTIDTILNGSYNTSNIVLSEFNNLSQYDSIMYEIATLLHDNVHLLNYIKDIINNEYEEIMYIYISLLLKNKDYKTIIKFLNENNFCNKVYLAELIYLYDSNNYDLMDFIVYVILGNFALADVDIESDIEYRVAVLNFEATRYDASYNKYTEIINKNMIYLNSPVTNRNISYLMYMNNDDRYKKYYKIYKGLLNSM